MKFSDLSKADWQGLRLYLDTCVLPVTGLTGEESPWEAAEALEHLRDALDVIEIPYRGRIVTYPALHYAGEESSQITALVEHTCRQLKEQVGFTYVIVVTANADIPLEQGKQVDLLVRMLNPQDQKEWKLQKDSVVEEIQTLWGTN